MLTSELSDGPHAVRAWEKSLGSRLVREVALGSVSHNQPRGSRLHRVAPSWPWVLTSHPAHRAGAPGWRPSCGLWRWACRQARSRVHYITSATSCWPEGSHVAGLHLREAGECRLAESREGRKHLAGLCGPGIRGLAKSDQPTFPAPSSWGLTLLQGAGGHYLLCLPYTTDIPLLLPEQEHSFSSIPSDFLKSYFCSELRG